MGESEGPQRAPFFHGKVLTPEDLEHTQQYFRERFKRHNRSLHGFGIVSGLNVSVKSGQVVVEQGLALDCSDADRRAAFVNVRFIDVCADRTAIAEAEESSERTGYLAESFELAVSPENSNRGHRHVRARWLACGQPHALTIAKLKLSSRGWRVERGYRAPHTK